jgi:hypothetical protein
MILANTAVVYLNVRWLDPSQDTSQSHLDRRLQYLPKTYINKTYNRKQRIRCEVTSRKWLCILPEDGQWGLKHVAVNINTLNNCCEGRRFSNNLDFLKYFVLTAMTSIFPSKQNTMAKSDSLHWNTDAELQEKIMHIIINIKIDFI